MPDFNGGSRADVPAQRLQTIEAYQGTHAPAAVLIPAECPARGTVKGFIYIAQGAADGAAAASLLEHRIWQLEWVFHAFHFIKKI